MTRFTRRRVLASVSVLGFAGTALPTARGPPWTTYTYAQPDEGDSRVRVAWYETYNETLQEHQLGTNQTTAEDTMDPDTGPTYVAEPDGPVIDLSDVVPGDSGLLAVGLSLAERPPESGPLAIDLGFDLLADAEAGRTEPEVKAGDTTNQDGELADAITASVWLDDGLPRCDAKRNSSDTLLAAGTLADVIGTIGGSYRLCEGCFDAVSHHCLGLRWSLPDGVGNVIQTDTAVFELSAEVHGRSGGEQA